MQLEDYFDFLAPDDIRIKGSRIGIETILYDYIFRKMPPEEIAAKWDTISLEQVYATILYYLHNKQTVHAYMAEYVEWSHRVREEQAHNPSPVRQRLQSILADGNRLKETA